MFSVHWKGGMAFEADPPSGIRFTMDANPEAGGQGLGPTPIEVLVASVAACSAIDVVSILQKKKQKVTAYRTEIEWERSPQGTYPRPILSIIVRHVVSGEAIDPAAVQHAVKLSDAKYCSVIATLRQSPAITSEYRVE